MFLSPKLEGDERTSDGRTVSIDGATTSDLAPAGGGAKGCGTETWEGDFLAIWGFNTDLGGGFEYVLFSPVSGEMIQFD